MIKRLTIFFLMLMSIVTQAQEATPSMGDTFRSEGKIYVVIAVMAIVFLSVIVYLLMMERRLKKLEDQIKDNK